jgi:hypothetical protein
VIRPITVGTGIPSLYLPLIHRPPDAGQ